MKGDNAIADKGRQGLGKADTPSNKGKQEGVQWETKGAKGRQDLREGGHTIQQKETRRQWETKGRQEDHREGGHTIQQKETRRQWEKRGDKKTIGKADTPSNKGKQEEAQWETKGDKTGTTGDKGRQDPPKGRHTI